MYTCSHSSGLACRLVIDIDVHACKQCSSQITDWRVCCCRIRAGVNAGQRRAGENWGGAARSQGGAGVSDTATEVMEHILVQAKEV